MKESSISFLVTDEEFQLLTEVVYLEPFLDEILSKAKIEGSKIGLKFVYDDLQDVVHALTHHAEYDDHPGRCEQLCDLVEKLEGYLQLRPHVLVYGKLKKKMKK